MRIKTFATLTAVVVGISACSWTENALVYKIDINQGNYVTQDLVDRLKVGQTKQQVRSALGTPLIADAFHDNRWDYMYRFQRQGRVQDQRKFTVYFADDKLTRWEGDQVPPSPRQLAESGKVDPTMAVDRSIPTKATMDDDGWFTKLLKRFGW